jgi:hypothetical protein
MPAHTHTHTHTHTQTHTVRRERLGKELSSFGGVIFVRADNDKINTLANIRGK